jgi:putative transposase
MDMEREHSRDQVYLINYHLIWCLQRRRQRLVKGIKHRLQAIIQEVAEHKKVKILALEIQPDHLHLFVSCYPQLAVHILVKAFKGRSSYYLRKEFPQLLRLPSLWTKSYLVSTAGNVSKQTIGKYIEAQSRK